MVLKEKVNKLIKRIGWVRGLHIAKTYEKHSSTTDKALNTNKQYVKVAIEALQKWTSKNGITNL